MTSPLTASINAGLETLVLKVFPHLGREDENFRICMNFAESHVHRHTFLSPDSHKIKRALKGVAEKMAVHSKTDKATLLRQSVEKFPTIPLFRPENEEEASRRHEPRIRSITGSAEETHYAILSFLLEMSVSPQETHRQLRLSHPFLKKKKDSDPGFDWGAFLREGEEDFSASVDTSGFLDSSESEIMSDFDDEFDDLEAVESAKKSFGSTAAASAAKEDSTESSTHSSLTPHSRYPEEIYADKKWLEKNLVPEYWRGRKSSPREIIFDNPRMSSCLAAHWQRKLMTDESEGALHVDEPVPTAWLTESQGLRECLWLLRGTNLKSPIFIVKKGAGGDSGRSFSSVKPNPKFCLSSLTPKEWENVVSVFGHYGLLRRRIDDFIRGVFQGDYLAPASSSSSSSSSSRTYQAFAGALNQLTKEDLGLVLESLEKRLISGNLRASPSTSILTLTNALNILRPQMEMLDVIGDILEQSVELDTVEESNAMRVSRLLSTMHRIIEHFDGVAPATSYGSAIGDSVGPGSGAMTSHPRPSASSYSLASSASFGSAQPAVSTSPSDNFVVSSMIWLWAQSLQPMVEIVDEWIRTGKLNDLQRECFITRNAGIQLDDDAFWAEGYSNAVTSKSDENRLAPIESDPHSLRSFFPASIVRNLVLAGKSMEVIQSLLKTEGLQDQRRHFPLRRHFASSLYADFVEALVKGNAGSSASMGATTAATKKLRFASPAVESMSVEADDWSAAGMTTTTRGRDAGDAAATRGRSHDRGSFASSRTRSVGDSRMEDATPSFSTFFHHLDSQLRNELSLTYPDPLLVINFDQTFSYDLISSISSMNEDPDRFRRSVVAEKDTLALASKLRGSAGGITPFAANASKSALLSSSDPLHFPSFNHLLDAGLFPLLRRRCSLVCRSLVDHLLQKANLLPQLAALRAVFLLEAGDAMHSFCLELFDQLNVGGEEAAFRQGFLNSALYDALSKHHEAVADQALCYVVAEESGNDKEATSGADSGASSIVCLDRLKIRFRIPWPLYPLVVTTSHLETYNLIFASLLQVKRAKYNLDSLKFADLRIDEEDVQKAVEEFRGGRSTSKGSVFLRDSRGELLATPAIISNMKHRVILFRQKLQHFVNGLHNYIMLRILHVIQVDFQQKLEAAHEIDNVDELRRMHETFVQQIWERCPLNPIFRNFRQLILRLLNFSVTLERRWRGPLVKKAFSAVDVMDEDLDASVDSLDSLDSPPPAPAPVPLSPTVVITEGLTPRNLEEMEYEMNQLITFIQTFLERVIKRGSFPHLKGFALEMLPW